MCKWAASDDDFFVVRRFGELSARVLLRLQDRIVEIEEELQRMDEWCRTNDADNGTFRGDPIDGRKLLMDEVTSRLEQYRRSYHFQQVVNCSKTFALTWTRKVSARSYADEGPR